MGIKEKISEELRSENFLLYYQHPGDFVQSQCGFPRVYSVWRCVWMIYHICAIISSGLLEKYYATNPDNRVKWFIFLTNWTFIVLTIQTIIDFTCSVFVNWAYPWWTEEGEVVPEGLPWYLKVLWVMSSITNALSVMVTIGYWGFGTFDSTKGITGYRVLPFLGHGMNSIYIVCNLFVTKMPVRLFHFWFPLVFTIVYGIFNVLYISLGATDDTGKPYIYPPMDWRKDPEKAETIALASVLGVVVSHILVFLLHALRRCICCACACKRRLHKANIKEEKMNIPVSSYGSTQDTLY